jgi:hypothetical protein
LCESRDLETRAKLRQEIRRKVSSINVHFDFPITGPNDIKPRRDQTFAHVRFVNGALRGLLFQGEHTYLMNLGKITEEQMGKLRSA